MNDEDSQKSLEKEQARGIESVENQIEQNLHKPFMVDPGMALSGIGKRVGSVYSALLPNILPKADVTP